MRISSGGEVTELFTCLHHVWAGKLEIANGMAASFGQVSNEF